MTALRNHSIKPHLLRGTVKNASEISTATYRIEDTFARQMPLDGVLIATTYLIVLAAVSLFICWQVGLCLAVVMIARATINRLRSMSGIIDNNTVVWNGQL